MATTITRPILRIGEWDASTGPLTVTQADMDAIRAAFDDPEMHTPALKLGHWSELNGDDGAPSFGWIVGLKQEGDTLLARIVVNDVALARAGISPDDIDALYPRGSVELWGDEQHPMVLSAFSLLGATEPAVGGIEVLSGVADAIAELDPAEGWTVRTERQIAAESGTPKARMRLAAPEVDIAKPGAGDGDGRDPIPDRGDDVDLTKLRAELGLDDQADEAAVLAEVTRIKNELAAKAPETKPAEGAPETSTVDAAGLAAMQATINELAAKNAAYEAERAAANADALVGAALSAGKIVAASKGVWVAAATKDFEGTKTLLEGMHAVVPTAAKGSSPAPSQLAAADKKNLIGLLSGGRANVQEG